MRNRCRLSKWALTVIATVFALLAPLLIKSPYRIHIFILTLIYIIAASSLRTIALSGQLSLGHAAFMSIGAYVSGILSKNLGWTPWVTMPLGALSTMAAAILVGYPFSRVRAFYFSIVSLFFGTVVLATNSVFVKYTGGTAALVGVPPLFNASRIYNYYFFLTLTVASLFALRRIETCRIGITFKAVAQSHQVASSVGIDEAAYRVIALAFGCFFVGLAGAGYAHYNMVLSHSTFNLLASINLLIYVLVGGIGSFAGPIIATAILIIVPELLRALKEFVPYLFAAILIIVIFVTPQGLAGLPAQVGSWIGSFRGKGTNPETF